MSTRGDRRAGDRCPAWPVKPGDLIHADQHGAVVHPARRRPPGPRRPRPASPGREAVIIAASQRSDFSYDKLAAALREPTRSIDVYPARFAWAAAGREMMAIGQDWEIIDERFRGHGAGNAWLETLHGGMPLAEGPVYFADGDYLVWSDIPNIPHAAITCPASAPACFRHSSATATATPRDGQAAWSPASMAAGASAARSMTG